MGDAVPDAPAPPKRQRLRPLRWARTVLLGLGAGSVGVTLVLLALENSFVYHPAPASVSWEPAPSDRFQDVALTTPAGVRLHAWWCPVDGARGAVLYCHGNAGNLSHRGHAVVAMQQALGESVLIFDYPGYGKSEGSPSEAGCYAAADTAYDWLRRVPKVPENHILLYGGSLGGGVAVDLACRRPHRALLLVRTFTSMPEVGQRLYPWLPVRWLMRNRFDSLAKIGQCHRPVVIASGTADGLVPFEQGRRLFEAANEPRLFYPLDGAGHNDPLPLAFFPEALRFIEQAEARQNPG
jgi:fermentation-respiration switch protein FrsA (DUF1100 family)